MSFKTCPHCGMRLVDRDFPEEDLEERIIILLQHVCPEYIEESFEVIHEILQSSPNIPPTAPDDSGTLRSVLKRMRMR